MKNVYFQPLPKIIAGNIYIFCIYVYYIHIIYIYILFGQRMQLVLADRPILYFAQNKQESRVPYFFGRSNNHVPHKITWLRTHREIIILGLDFDFLFRKYIYALQKQPTTIPQWISTSGVWGGEDVCSLTSTLEGQRAKRLFPTYPQRKDERSIDSK